ncbi:DUF3499 domain-containing protein [Mycobacterium sp.]|uniref:DUF3499 domain-containing protein n=1 Tax=Mycobacterium sp. TaxID=1785 RepID=UPI003A84B311
MNVPRRCCRPGCQHYAVATLTFVYSDSTAVVGPLATAPEPHSWDLCVGHAGRITAPRGWELVRHSGPLPGNPDEDDLVALADAVREGGAGAAGAAGVLASGFNTDGGDGYEDVAGPGGDSEFSPAGAPAAALRGAVLTAPDNRSGRRRGHLRVLPDPAD